MPSDTLETLKFYVDALAQHRNAGKKDEDFIKKIEKLYLLDEMPLNVYEMMLTVIRNPENIGLGFIKTDASIKPAEKPYKETADKTSAKVKEESKKAEKVSAGPKPRNLDSDTIRRVQSLLSFMKFYVEDKTSRDGYRGVTSKDVLAGMDLYTAVVYGDDPCSGPLLKYSRIDFDLFMAKVMNPLGSNSSNGSCGGGSSAPRNTGSCSGGNSGPTGRC